MLTIENITKVYKKNVGIWRIGRVETINTAYLFTLVNPVGNRIQINLERNPIGLQKQTNKTKQTKTMQTQKNKKHNKTSTKKQKN